jgi:FkbM family methyltransferase
MNRWRVCLAGSITVVALCLLYAAVSSDDAEIIEVRAWSPADSDDVSGDGKAAKVGRTDDSNHDNSPASPSERGAAVVAGSPGGGHGGGRKKKPPCMVFYGKMKGRFFSVNRFVAFNHGAEILITSPFAQLFSNICADMAVDVAANRAGSGSPSAVVIDIGANDGEDVPDWFQMFGADGSSRCGSLIRFYLVEPQQKYQSTLQRIAVDGRPTKGSDVRVLHAAVGRDEQHGTFLTMVGSGQQGMVNMDNATGVKIDRAKQQQETTRVPMISLRRVLEEDKIGRQVPILLLKVDCEGADSTILVDSSYLFTERRVEMLVMEINSRQKHFAVRHTDAANMLENAGYTLFIAGVNAKTRELMTMHIRARQLVLWPASLETLVAFSPAMMRRLRQGGERGRRGAFAAIHGSKYTGRIVTHPRCHGGFFTWPCPLCQELRNVTTVVRSPKKQRKAAPREDDEA